MSSAKKGLELVIALSKRISAGNAFDRVLNKVKFTSGGDGRCTAELQIEEQHQNPGGTLHGGLTATLVDSVSTIALMTNDQGRPGVSVDLHVSYLKAAKNGEVVVIDAKTLKAGRNLAFLEVELRKKEGGDLIAKGSHTKFIG